MPKTTTALQRASSQRNAQKSTGPRTARGKARSARNALRHGLLARDLIVNTPYAVERRADFDALLADLVAELKPRNVIEETLVERIATAYWRLRRAQRLESAAVRQAADAADAADPRDAEIARTTRILDDTAADLRLECRLAQQLDKPKDALSPEEAAELDDSLADFARVNALAALGLQGQALKDRVRDMLPAVIAELERNTAALRTNLENAHRDRDARLTRQGAQASLPTGDAFLRIVRYETMLDCQIHRALTQLRRLRSCEPRRRRSEKHPESEEKNAEGRSAGAIPTSHLADAEDSNAAPNGPRAQKMQIAETNPNVAQT